VVARHWPWWAVVTGVIWLFLLPAGAFGLAVAFIAAWVLIARTHRPAVPNATPNASQVLPENRQP
jgi:hypothetical protein